MDQIQLPLSHAEMGPDSALHAAYLRCPAVRRRRSYQEMMADPLLRRALELMANNTRRL